MHNTETLFDGFLIINISASPLTQLTKSYENDKGGNFIMKTWNGYKKYVQTIDPVIAEDISEIEIVSALVNTMTDSHKITRNNLISFLPDKISKQTQQPSDQYFHC